MALPTLAVLRVFGTLTLCIAACSGSDPGSGDGGGGDSSDAAPPTCEERMPLTIGHCVEADTGDPCVSGESEMQLFRSLEDARIVHPIIGLQGSPMFVMAVQAEGIATGENSDAPRVDVRVFDGEQDVGGFSSNPIVIESATTPGLVTAPRLFVVSFFAEDLVGKTLDVTAEVKDRNDQTWCSKDSFEVGALIDAPAPP
jgi:hypothetical protein